MAVDTRDYYRDRIRKKTHYVERADFRGKSALSLLMLSPLVIPGVILGISILAFASRLAQFADDVWGLDLDFLRPGLPLVVAGQFSYIVSIATLTIANGSNTQQATWQSTTISGYQYQATAMFVVVPGAGSVTYKLRLSTTAGTVDMQAFAASPAFILIEDIGV